MEIDSYVCVRALLDDVELHIRLNSIFDSMDGLECHGEAFSKISNFPFNSFSSIYFLNFKPTEIKSLCKWLTSRIYGIDANICV